MALIQEIKVPLLAVNDTSLTVVEMNFTTGAQVKKGDLLMVFETSKTTYDVEAETDGFIQFYCEAGQDYEVNEVVAKIFEHESEIQKSTVSPALAKPEKSTTPVPVTADLIESAVWEGDTLFSSEAFRLLESSGLNHAIFTGRDFVSKLDVEQILGISEKKAVKNKPSEIKSATPGNAVKARTTLPIDQSKVIIEKLSSNKKREIEYLSEVQSTGLTSTINTIIETEGIFTYINPSLKYLKNSLLPVILYETGRLLQKYPLLNAYYTGESIAVYKNINVGFAIDIDKGLKVLKVADTASRSVAEIENSIMELSNCYLDDSLKIEDLIDVSFTITDLSSEAVAFFRPLVNMMNSAILGVSAIDEKLQRCTLSLTFDHRVTEGKYVAQFLKELKDRLQSYQSKHYSNLNQQITCSKCYKTLGEDLADTGFVKCITPSGSEGYLCQSCLKGF